MGLEIRLLGGFEVRSSRSPEAHFESQKVRALLAYLATSPDHAFSRDHLSALLWPESDGDSARRNLRQALYNLRQTLGDDGEILEADHQQVRLRAGADDRVDVEEFERERRRGLPGGDEVLVSHLVRAVELYRGEFLAGFYVKQSSAFEEWLVAEQERLRDAAIGGLRVLVDHFSARGEYDAALGHARRLIEIDPLSEEAHRELMRLYVLGGRRRRALTQFEELAELLERELGVEPLPETRALYESILAEDLPAARHEPVRPPLGPFVPLVGRGGQLGELSESWQSAVERTPRLALVDGPPGIGKTRLVRSFLDRISSQRTATVVQGRCLGPAPQTAAQPWAEVVLSLAWLSRDGESAPGVAGTAEPGTAAATPPATLEERVTGAIAAFRAAAPAADAGRPLVVFLDDLHWAGESSLALLPPLLDGVAGRPLWLVAAVDSAQLEASSPLHDLLEHPAVDHVLLDRLGRRDLERVGAALVGEGDDAARLAAHLSAASGGMPLDVVEHINYLCDEGILTPGSRQRWSLAGEPRMARVVGIDLDELISRRLHRLPTSTRRLLTLAAVIGQTFDVELLQRAAREHIGVVEIGIELMLERWMVRQYARRWSDSPRERDLVLWAQGARRGSFEFAHARIRQAAREDVNPLRRRSLHREVASALAERFEPEHEPAVEQVAYHYLEAGEPAPALPYLRAAAEKSARWGDASTAARLADQALAVIARLEGDASASERREMERQREAVLRAAGRGPQPAAGGA